MKILLNAVRIAVVSIIVMIGLTVQISAAQAVENSCCHNNNVTLERVGDSCIIDFEAGDVLQYADVAALGDQAKVVAEVEGIGPIGGIYIPAWQFEEIELIPLPVPVKVSLVEGEQLNIQCYD